MGRIWFEGLKGLKGLKGLNAESCDLFQMLLWGNHIFCVQNHMGEGGGTIGLSFEQGALWAHACAAVQYRNNASYIHQPNARDPLHGVHRDPPGVRRTPGTMRCKSVITRRGSCRGPLPRKAWPTGIHIETIRYLCVVDSRGSPYATLYARCTQGGFWWILDLIHWTPDSWNVSCFYLRVVGSSWILMYARRILCSGSQALVTNGISVKQCLHVWGVKTNPAVCVWVRVFVSVRTTLFYTNTQVRLQGCSSPNPPSAAATPSTPDHGVTTSDQTASMLSIGSGFPTIAAQSLQGP